MADEIKELVYLNVFGLSINYLVMIIILITILLGCTYIAPFLTRFRKIFISCLIVSIVFVLIWGTKSFFVETKLAIQYAEELESEKYQIIALNTEKNEAYSYNDIAFFYADMRDIEVFNTFYITYRDRENGSIKNAIITPIVQTDIPDGEKPYVEMKTIKEKVGNQLEPGNYDPVLHISEQDLEKILNE